tara:strand:+ start:87 stop:290 length:204 start_codon:yes stop_codon:yes gene_type:complete
MSYQIYENLEKAILALRSVILSGWSNKDEPGEEAQTGNEYGRPQEKRSVTVLLIRKMFQDWGPNYGG